MNKNELQEYLKVKNISSSLYSLDGGLPDDKICLHKELNCWVVYYSERGARFDSIYFEKEEDACDYILEQIKKVVAIK